MNLSSTEIAAMVQQVIDGWNREDSRKNQPFTSQTVIGFNFEDFLKKERSRADEAHTILQRIQTIQNTPQTGEKKYVD